VQNIVVDIILIQFTNLYGSGGGGWRGRGVGYTDVLAGEVAIVMKSC